MNWTEGNLARFAKGWKRSKKRDMRLKQREHFARVRNRLIAPVKSPSQAPLALLEGKLPHETNPPFKRRKCRKSTPAESPKAGDHDHSQLSDSENRRMWSQQPRKLSPHGQNDFLQSHSIPGKDDGPVLPQDLALLKRRRNGLLQKQDWVGINFQRRINEEFPKPIKNTTRAQWSKKSCTGPKPRRKDPQNPKNRSLSPRTCPEEDYRIRIGSQVGASTTVPSLQAVGKSCNDDMDYEISSAFPNYGSSYGEDAQIQLGHGGHGSSGREACPGKHQAECREIVEASDAWSSSYNTSEICHPIPRRPQISKLLRGEPLKNVDSHEDSMIVEVPRPHRTLPDKLVEETTDWRKYFVSTKVAESDLTPQGERKMSISPGISIWRPRHSSFSRAQDGEPRNVSRSPQVDIPRDPTLHPTTVAEECPSISENSGQSLLSLSETLDPTVFGLEEPSPTWELDSQWFPSSSPPSCKRREMVSIPVSPSNENSYPVKDTRVDEQPESVGTAVSQYLPNPATSLNMRFGQGLEDNKKFLGSQNRTRQGERITTAPEPGDFETRITDVHATLTAPRNTSLETLKTKRGVPIPCFTKLKSPPVADFNSLWQNFIFLSNDDNDRKDAFSEAKHAAARSIVPSIPSIVTEYATNMRKSATPTISRTTTAAKGTINREWKGRQSRGGPSNIITDLNQANTTANRSLTGIEAGLGLDGSNNRTCGESLRRSYIPSDARVTLGLDAESVSSPPVPISPRVEMERRKSALAMPSSSSDRLKFDESHNLTLSSACCMSNTTEASMRPRCGSDAATQPSCKWAPPSAVAFQSLQKQRRRSFRATVIPKGRTETVRGSRYEKTGQVDIKGFPDLIDDPIEDS